MNLHKNWKGLAMTCALMAAVSPVWAQEETYAEKLGWPKGTRAVILHVDDAGMSYDSNIGAIRAIDEGAANSLSVMMPTPWVPQIVRGIKANPRHDAGLHLTLTSEWDVYRWGPVAGKLAVPGLVDEDGCLWDNVPLVIEHASPDEVETEIRAQLDRARTMGFEPTHMDSHMGTLFSDPRYLERYVKIGIEENIPVMLPGGHNTLISRGRPTQMEQYRALGKRLWDAGLPVIDDLHSSSYNWKSREKTDEYVDAIRNLKPGVTMVIMHCTELTDVFPRISSSGDLRQGDLNAMLDPRFKQALEEEGIVLTTWRELKERRDAVGR